MLIILIRCPAGCSAVPAISEKEEILLCPATKSNSFFHSPSLRQLRMVPETRKEKTRGKNSTWKVRATFSRGWKSLIRSFSPGRTSICCMNPFPRSSCRCHRVSSPAPCFRSPVFPQSSSKNSIFFALIFVCLLPSQQPFNLLNLQIVNQPFVPIILPTIWISKFSDLSSNSMLSLCLVFKQKRRNSDVFCNPSYAFTFPRFSAGKP